MNTNAINSTSRKYESEIRKATAAYLRKRGMANSEIAAILGVSYGTIYKYLGPQPSHNFGGTFTPKTKKKPGRKPKDKQTPNVTPISDMTTEAKMELLCNHVSDLTNAVALLVRKIESETPGKHLKKAV